MEEWKPIRDHPSYSVSSYGRIRNEKFNRELRAYPNGRSGQLSVRLGRGTDAKDYYVHRLVAEHFHPDYDASRRYRHKNDDVRDNRPENLEPQQWSASPRRGGRTRR